MRLLLRAADELFAGPESDSASLHAWVRAQHSHAAPTLDLLVQPHSPDGLCGDEGVIVMAQGMRAGTLSRPVAMQSTTGHLVCAWESPAEQAIRLAIRSPRGWICHQRADGGRPAVGRRNVRLTPSVGGGFIARWDQGSDRRYARLFAADGRPLSGEVRLSTRGRSAGSRAA